MDEKQLGRRLSKLERKIKKMTSPENDSGNKSEQQHKERRRSGVEVIMLGTFTVAVAGVCLYFITQELSRRETQKYTASSPFITPSTEICLQPQRTISTPPELQQFLGLEVNGIIGEETKAHIQAFQEKCNYVLGIRVDITGVPDGNTYLAATLVNSSPALKEKIDSIHEYSYVNRTVLGYELRIPHLALQKVKEQLQRRRNLEAVLDWTDPFITKIAQEVTAEDNSTHKKAIHLLRFVQNLPYNYDIDDYAKHPLETIADGGGDCEDKSALYASLIKAVGIDSAVICFPKHVMAAIKGDWGGWFVIDGKEKYTLAETTGRWKLGDIDKDFQRKPSECFIKL